MVLPIFLYSLLTLHNQETRCVIYSKINSVKIELYHVATCLYSSNVFGTIQHNGFNEKAFEF